LHQLGHQVSMRRQLAVKHAQQDNSSESDHLIQQCVEIAACDEESNQICILIRELNRLNSRGDRCSMKNIKLKMQLQSSTLLTHW